MNQTWKSNKKKLILGLILDDLAQFWAPIFCEFYLY